MYEDLLNKNKTIAIIGLGYVGLPLAVLFSKKFNVIGFDVDTKKIECYKNGQDITCELPKNTLKNSKIKFSDDENELKNASFYIIAVPTPINNEDNPDFKYIISASEIVGKYIKKNDIIVYESTVYPGVTEDLCIPIIEKISGLKCIEDFKVGYSPERINPGDKNNKIQDITKIVSGIDEESLDIISKTYDSVLNNGIYKAESIKIAEAAKIVENITRDVNIALVNEFSMIFNKMNINTTDVIEAAGTKWNFQKYFPGLVGGHCISVDPYYLLYKSKKLNFYPKLMEISREINENLSNFIVKNIIQIMIKNNIQIKNANILILGVTFKENCNDIRNSKIIKVINELNNEYCINTHIYDPFANVDDVKQTYGIDLIDKCDGKYDVIIIAVAHNPFKDLTLNKLEKLSNNNPIIIDLKSVLSKEIQKSEKISYWSL
ncbi:nucleotide sugar dehydrogenase [uncultured Methanobrevibacter sp.]|uniref:nucleotide sugar dehydrogenase n=1 Tax=uncultured Methanobrevibacter sp. TaxID=253161 RepID=UPI0025DC7554|nr:nucleotide sugar dehydrogenase [uncultured Methanobrevibacter sp.]